MKFQTISFNGQSLAAINQNQTIYVAMKPICENIGLDWEAQRQKIQRNHILNSVACMLKATAKDGKNYETMCLPLGFLSGWLMSVEVNRVKPEIRDMLIQYQLKCYDVLHQHFMPNQPVQPKPTKALPNGLTAEQIETVKKLHNALVKSAPKEQQANIAITLWSAVKSKFGVSYKEVPAEQFAEVLSVMSRVAVDKGVLYGELLEKQPAPALPVLDDALLLAFARLLLHAQDMRLFVNRYLPAFQNLGIDGRGSLWSFVHDTEPTFTAVRRFMAAQSVQSGFFARDWAWVQSRILSTARAF